nr:pitrilysin family protein [Palleronia pontilimi]
MPAQAAVDIQEVTSPGGITAWLVEDHSIPFAALEIRFQGGSVLDPEGKEGVVNLMMGLLEEGAANMDAQAFALAREELAASFGFDASDDTVSISARFLTENRDAAVELLRKALVEPSFDQVAVDRVRDQVLSIVAGNQTDPDTMAQQAFAERAYPDHPYSAPNDGTLDSVRGLTRDDVVAAHRAALVRDRVHVGAVGDITPEALGEILDTLFSDLPVSETPLPGRADYSAEPGVTVVDFDTPQSVILFGHEGITRDDPDFFAAYILNEIFGGGGFNSRLMDEVRVKRGLTYGVGTWLQPMDYGELVMGQASSANSSAAETVQVIRDEWARVAEGVTEEELQAAKTYLTGAYPLRFDGNARIAGILVGMQMDDLGLDYIETRNDKVNAVTLDDIRRVAERVYRPEDLSFVVVGQPEGLEATN